MYHHLYKSTSRDKFQITTDIRPPLLVWLLALAFLHGALYAGAMPPWGLIDEAQHYHYIEYAVGTGTLPVAGTLVLSDDIIRSLFATNHWEVFHWPTPTSDDPHELGLVAYSYEAYQPPLFYLTLAPLWGSVAGDALNTLFFLRGAVVLLSLISVWAIYKTTQTIYPSRPYLSILTTLLFILWPERTIAVSRLNNDVLADVFGALLSMSITVAWFRGLTPARARRIGLLWGAGIATKISMGLWVIPLGLLFWIKNRYPEDLSIPAWCSGMAGLFLAPILVRNWLIYGDLTGFAGFEQLHTLHPPNFSIENSIGILSSTFKNTWVVWWKGADVGTNPLVTIMVLFIGLLYILAIGRWIRNSRTEPTSPTVSGLSGIWLISILGYGAFVIWAYFAGIIPVTQGRFLLPIGTPLILFLVVHLWQYGRGSLLLLFLALIFGILDILSLFGNLLPYHYYWSTLAPTASIPVDVLSVWEALDLLITRWGADKPPLIRWLTPVIGILYFTILSICFIHIARLLRYQPISVQ